MAIIFQGFPSLPDMETFQSLFDDVTKYSFLEWIVSLFFSIVILPERKRKRSRREIELEIAFHSLIEKLNERGPSSLF